MIIDMNREDERKVYEVYKLFDKYLNKTKETLNKETYLEQQLMEKDKEIRDLKTQFDFYRSLSIQKSWNDPELIKSIRKQVCGEIRQAFNKEYFWVYGDNNKIISIHKDEFNKILDQI